MPKRSSKPRDVNRLARSIVDQATGTERQKNPAAVELGRLGGRKGGIARAASLSAKKRAEIASKAAKARLAARVKPGKSKAKRDSS
jgi:hypothetical protein